jgi:two-component system, LuxR family, response regulator FixJ
MIFIVDDDALVRDSTVDLLNSLGCPAVAFGSAEAFLDRWDGNDPLCLVLDQQLPGMNGLELQNQLHLAGCLAAIIFITADPDPAVRQRALNAGAVAYLNKPYEQGDLIVALKAALSRR